MTVSSNVFRFLILSLTLLISVSGMAAQSSPNSTLQDLDDVTVFEVESIKPSFKMKNGVYSGYWEFDAYIMSCLDSPSVPLLRQEDIQVGSKMKIYFSILEIPDGTGMTCMQKSNMKRVKFKINFGTYMLPEEIKTVEVVQSLGGYERVEKVYVSEALK